MGSPRYITVPGSDARGKNLGKETPVMTKHILVVDDDAALLSILKMRLKNIGHTVDTAETGWDGLSKLECADYDVVLLDYLMPGITGQTVLQHIQERHPSVPVVMMTVYKSSQVAAQALAAGARTCLVKPVGPVELDQACSAVSERLRKNGRIRRHETTSRSTRQGTDRGTSLSQTTRETRTNQRWRRNQ
jgi:DNA-binding NtrC family response regulator